MHFNKQVGQIYRSTVGRRGRTPLASSLPRCHYARVRYSEILIPMPLHFAITITQSSPGCAAPDLCRLAIYITSKCFSIPTAAGLIATEMDIRAFTFPTFDVFLLPPMLFHRAGAPNVSQPARWVMERTRISILKNALQLLLLLCDWPWGKVIHHIMFYLKHTSTRAHTHHGAFTAPL